MKLVSGNAIPQRKGKPQPNPLERHEPYLLLRSMILNGKMKPQQEEALLFDEHDAQALGLQSPARSALDRLKKTLRDAGLTSDYRIVKYQSSTPGVWVVKVSYEPPITMTGTASEAAPAARRGRSRKTA